MNFFMRDRANSSGQTDGQRVISPPTYDSHKSLPSYISYTELEDPIPAPITPTPAAPIAYEETGTPTPPANRDLPVEDSEQETRNKDNGQKQPRFLRIHLEERTALTQLSSRFEEIERSTRRIFDVDNSAAISISADIPSFDNERMIIDPTIWKMVYKDISEVWITLLPGRKRRSSPTADMRTVEVHIANRYSKTHNFHVKIARDATIGDLKHAITKRKPKYQVADLVPQTTLEGAAADSDVLDDALAYRGRYNFIHDELAFIAQMRADTMKRQSTSQAS